MNRYDIIKNNIIYEENIFYKKNGKEYVGCLVKSKYADNSDQIEFYLFENKTIRNAFLCLDLIEYEKAEKKDAGWKSLSSQKVLFYFELIPKHQQQKEIFASETEENRTKWMKIFNENIAKLNTNNTYEIDSDDEKLIDDAEKTEPKPAIFPRTFNSQETNKKLPKLDPSQSAVINQLHHVLLKPKKPSLKDDDVFYRGTFEDLQKILLNINKSGVYAVSTKIKPESNCTLALRVYENDQRPISSWNIYQKEKIEYFLFEGGLMFPNITQLCLYYTENDLPSESSTIKRLIGPYKYYLQ